MFRSIFDRGLTLISDARNAIARQRADQIGSPADTDEFDTEAELQQHLVKLRRYYNGKHKVRLSDRQRAYLAQQGTKGDDDYSVNYCRIIVNSRVERLSVTAIQALPSGRGVTLSENDPTAAVYQDWWRRARLDAYQTDIYRDSGIDAESFVIISWSEKDQAPDFIVHPRYVAKKNGGSGYGVWLDYPNSDYRQPAIRATKRWDEDIGSGKFVERKTVYYPDRIERYKRTDKGWEPFIEPFAEMEQPVEDDEAEGEEVINWPEPFVDDGGEPLGIPVVHFRTPGLTRVLTDVLGLQNGDNKTWVDLWGAADSTAFRILIFRGWIPTSDGKEPAADKSYLLHIVPGSMIATKKMPDEAAVDVVDPAEIRGLLELEERTVLRMAGITSTPSSRFQTSKQLEAAETIRQQEAPLVSVVEHLQIAYGNAWEDAFSIGQTLEHTFADATETNPDAVAQVSWKNAATRNEKTATEIAINKKSLGIPEQFLWGSDLGLTAEEVELIKAMPEHKIRLAQQEAAATLLGQARTPGAETDGSEGDDDDDDAAT